MLCICKYFFISKNLKFKAARTLNTTILLFHYKFSFIYVVQLLQIINKVK